MFKKGKWEYEVELAQQARLDLEPFVSQQSLIRRELAKRIVSKFRRGKGCAIINGSVNWGYARKESDIDICYYPNNYGYIIRFFSGKGIVKVRLHQKFHDRFRDYGYKSEPIGFYHSIKELREYLANAKKTGEVPVDLVRVHKLAQTGIMIGNELEEIIAETEEMRRSLNPEQLKQARLDKLFGVLPPVGSSMKKFIKILESEGHNPPKSVIILRDHMGKY